MRQKPATVPPYKLSAGDIDITLALSPIKGAKLFKYSKEKAILVARHDII